MFHLENTHYPENTDTQAYNYLLSTSFNIILKNTWLQLLTKNVFENFENFPSKMTALYGSHKLLMKLS